MESMIEHGIGIKMLITTIAKVIMWAAIGLGCEPILGWLITQVEHQGFLPEYWKNFLADIKIILGVLISALAVIKLWMSIANFRKNKK